jgi:hypothetical protein
MVRNPQSLRGFKLPTRIINVTIYYGRYLYYIQPHLLESTSDTPPLSEEISAARFLAVIRFNTAELILYLRVRNALPV